MVTVKSPIRKSVTLGWSRSDMLENFQTGESHGEELPGFQGPRPGTEKKKKRSGSESFSLS